MAAHLQVLGVGRGWPAACFRFRTLRDFRYALRTLAKSLGFALVAIISLALDMGANSAMPYGGAIANEGREPWGRVSGFDPDYADLRAAASLSRGWRRRSSARSDLRPIRTRFPR